MHLSYTQNAGMHFREATIRDIPAIQIVRHAVKENRLSNPALVTDAVCENYLVTRGKGWVCEIDDRIIGFAIADLEDNNIWALFVDPQFEQKGIGSALQKIMLHWYFNQTQHTVWLNTGPNTRAALFYEKKGWTNMGLQGKEIRFEMSYQQWLQYNS